MQIFWITNERLKQRNKQTNPRNSSNNKMLKHKTPRSKNLGIIVEKKVEGNICECYTNSGFITALFFEIKATSQSGIIFESESNMGDLRQCIENRKHWGFELKKKKN